MFSWVAYSFIAMVLFSGIYLHLKALTQHSIHAFVINFWFFALMALGFASVNLFTKTSFSVPKASWPIYAGLIFVGVLGNYFSVKAYEVAPNPGYVTAIMACSMVVVTVLSVFLFKSTINPLQWLGVALVLVGVSLITFGGWR